MFFFVVSYWFNMCQSVHNVDCGKSSAICRTDDGLGGTAVSLGSLHAQDIIYSSKVATATGSSCVDIVITARGVTDQGCESCCRVVSDSCSNVAVLLMCCRWSHHCKL